jgi:3-hydroxyisobutyrate dehydrogenase-like beta-hydroxyacid dehydrogenase
MAFASIGLLHPGEMGAGIGAVLVDAGYTVLWASTGRSEVSAPDGFPRAAAEIYARPRRDEEAEADIATLKDVLDAIREGPA